MAARQSDTQKQDKQGSETKRDPEARRSANEAQQDTATRQTQRDKAGQGKTKQDAAKQNKTQQNKAKHNKTARRSKTRLEPPTSPHPLPIHPQKAPAWKSNTRQENIGQYVY